MKNCILIGSSYKNCRALLPYVSNRFEAVRIIWLASQCSLNLQISNCTSIDDQDQFNPLNSFDEACTVLFSGFPVLHDLYSWQQLDQNQQFCTQEYWSAIQSALLLTKSKVINRGVLERSNGFPPDPALSIRLLAAIGWDIANLKVLWRADSRLQEDGEASATFGLWISRCAHQFDDYGHLRFPTVMNVDGLIRATQRWLNKESFACCELRLAINGDKLQVVYATVGRIPLGLSPQKMQILIDGMMH
jgi:hypothetical protein